MSAITYIKGLLGLNGSDAAEDGLDVLADLLAQREVTLALDAEYAKPTTSTVGEPTAVFPVSLTHEGEDYGAHAKEFPLPDDGLDDAEAALTLFVADATGTAPEDVTFADLSSVEGLTADARLTEGGDIAVDAPSGATDVDITQE